MSESVLPKKIGRNAPCPCGSGKKYKKCCLENIAIEHPSENKSANTVHDDQINFLMNNVRERFHDKAINIIDVEKIGLIKMSEVILEYADELLDSATTEKEERKAIMVSIVAWNLALMDDDKCGKELENFLKNMMKIKKNSDDWKVVSSILQALIHKKRMYYASIDRLIVNYSISKTNDGLNLNIVSIVFPDDVEEK